MLPAYNGTVCDYNQKQRVKKIKLIPGEKSKNLKRSYTECEPN
jgi:hypothetical protein